MARLLILFNQIDDDVYEHYRRDGKRTVDWDPSIVVEPWETVAEEYELIVRSLEAGGHDVTMVNIRDDFGALLGALRQHKPDLVINFIEFYGNDPEHEHHVPSLFELLGIPYTGNRPLALSLCQKKPQAKAVLAAAGVRTPRGVVVEVGAQAAIPHDLRFPRIVKPAYDDASGGIDPGSVVHDHAAMQARIEKLHRENKMGVLVEEYIDGREIHCAILADEVLPLYEIAFKPMLDEHGQPLPRIITYRAKWDPFSREHHAVEGKCPVDDLEPEIVEAIQETARAAYRALNCRDYARVDMRVDTSTGEVFVLEVNPNPDLADTCAFFRSARATGRTYQQMICEIVDSALARAREPQAAATDDDLLREYQARAKH